MRIRYSSSGHIIAGCLIGVNVTLQVVSDAMLAELKQCFMEAYDDNQDGKIDIREARHYGDVKDLKEKDQKISQSTLVDVFLVCLFFF